MPMNGKTELYRPEDIGTLKKKYHAWLTVVCLIAAAALAACVLFCLRTGTANALRMEILAVSVFTVAGWVDIYLLTFVVSALHREEEHAARMLAGDRETMGGKVELGRETIRIRKSIAVRSVTVSHGNETRRLFVNARRALPLERALAAGDTECELDTVGGFVAAFGVCHADR